MQVKKREQLKIWIKLKKLEEKENFSDFFDSYKKDVLDIRNKLAHAKSEVIDDEEWLIIDGGEAEKYGTEECKQIRKCLKRYSEYLSELHGIISDN